MAVSNVDPKDYLAVLLDSLLFKDVVKRHRVKFSTQVREFSRTLDKQFCQSVYSS